MSFTQGFEKVAWNPMTGVGQVAGAASKAKKTLVEGTKNLLAGGKASRIEGFTGGRQVGSNLAKSRMRQAAEYGKPVAQATQTRKDAAKRLSSMQSYKAEKALKDKPSFARKHPFVTAGALYLGARTALGGGDDKQQQQQPQVMSGQY